MKIKIKLTKLLKKRGISAKTFADRTGISAPCISLFRHQKTKSILYKNILTMCKVLECRLEDIIVIVYEEGEKAPKNEKKKWSLPSWLCGK